MVVRGFGNFCLYHRHLFAVKNLIYNRKIIPGILTFNSVRWFYEKKEEEKNFQTGYLVF